VNGLILALLLSAAPMPVEQYVGALERIDSLLASDQLTAAQTEARGLIGVTIASSQGTFRSDRALLAAIANASRAEGPHRARLMFAIDELRRATGMETGRADPKLLERIAAEQAVPELPKGGEIRTTAEVEPPPLFERIVQGIDDAWEWVLKQLGRLLRWILDLFPRGQPGSGSGSLRWIVLTVVIAILAVILILALMVLRRSRAAETETAETSEPLGSRQDEDPLSRGAHEWERYAAQLAGSARFREAIRAWYHAVLVTCYAAGVLHFRKGRTNWEYIASLAPSLAWRADLIALTRQFETEWYGRAESTRERHDDCRELAQRIIAAIQRELRGAA
jgi:Domain of unknown function (DUF4129)